MCLACRRSWRNSDHIGLVVGVLGGTQRLDVKKIARTSAGELVADQIFARDDVNRRFVIDCTIDAIRPCFVEAHTINVLQDVDAFWRLANLKS